MKNQVSQKQSGIWASVFIVMIVYEYERIDLHRETKSLIRPTDEVCKKDPDKLLGNSKETAVFCFWIEPLDTQRFSPVHSALPTALSQHELRRLSKFKWEVPAWQPSKENLPKLQQA